MAPPCGLYWKLVLACWSLLALGDLKSLTIASLDFLSKNKEVDLQMSRMNWCGRPFYTY